MIALLLCLTVACFLAPDVAFAADYWVGHTEINRGTSVSGDGWEWVSDGAQGTLTLTDAALRGADTSATDDSASAVKLPEGSTVVLVGDNTLLGGVASDAAGGTSRALYINGALTLTGSGTLTAVGGEAGYMSYGIDGGSVTFDADFTGCVCAVGGAAGNSSYGLSASTTDFTMRGTGSITAVGGRSLNSYGMYAAKKFDVRATAHINATGGESPGASGGESRGIYCSGDFSVSAAANITATGGWATGTCTSVGIRLFNSSLQKVTLSGGANVTAVGGKANNSYGVSAYLQDTYVTIGGVSALTAVGGEGTSSSYGMLLGEAVSAGNTNTCDVKVDSGALVTKGGSAPNSFGFAANRSPGLIISLGDDIGVGDSVVVAHASGSTTTTALFGASTVPDGPNKLAGLRCQIPPLPARFLL